jgi:hypothetical protein
MAFTQIISFFILQPHSLTIFSRVLFYTHRKQLKLSELIRHFTHAKTNKNDWGGEKSYTGCEANGSAQQTALAVAALALAALAVAAIAVAALAVAALAVAALVEAALAVAARAVAALSVATLTVHCK